jgi:hypothetical protein
VRITRKARKFFFFCLVRNLRGCSSLQNASINIPPRVMSSAGWGGGEPSPEPADEAGGAKPQLNAGSLVLQGGVAHKKET